jgi:hypothetical protein
MLRKPENLGVVSEEHRVVNSDDGFAERSKVAWWKGDVNQ